MAFKTFQEQLNTGETPEQAPVGRKQRGTGFTNISRILEANVGAGQQMGSAIGQSMGQQAGKIKAGVEKSAQQFRQQSEQAQQAATQGVTAAGQYAAPEGPGMSNVAGLTEEQAKEAGKKLAEAEYKGPKELAGAGLFSGQAQGLQRSAMATSSPFGRGQALRGIVGGATPYSRGQSLLDTALIGQDVAGRQAIAQGAQQALQASQDVLGQIAGGQGLAQQAAKGIEAQKEKTIQNLTSALGKIKESGEAAAGEYSGKIGRIGELLATDDKLRPELAGQLSTSDLELLDNLSKYGIDPNMQVFTEDPALNKILLQDIIKSAGTEGLGKYKFTEPQQAAAKNLALLTQQEDEAKALGKNIFTTDPFSKSMKAISGKMEKREEDRAKDEALGKRYLDFGNEFRKKMDEILGAGYSTRKRIIAEETEAFENLRKKYGFTPEEAGQIAGWRGTKSEVADQLRGSGAALLEKSRQKQASKMALKDYIKKLYGI